MMRMNDDSAKQIALGTIKGHSCFNQPNDVQSAKAATVSRKRVLREIALVLRVSIMRHACGAKLAVDKAAANQPIIVTMSIAFLLRSKRKCGVAKRYDL